MEVFALMFAIAAAPVASVMYCFLLSIFKVSSWRIAPYMRISSMVVLGLFAIEAVFLATLGAIRSRAILGPAFEYVYNLLFVAGVPALANVLLLRRATRVRWYSASLPCIVLALVLVFLQVSITESLYGIDGIGGPYSTSQQP